MSKSATRTAAVRLSRLYKDFATPIAVDLEVPIGAVHGLVGPAGSGKTTVLSMAAGLLRPDGGDARIFGVDVSADPGAALSLAGVLPAELSLPGRLTGEELLTYLGLLRGLNPAGGRVAELLALLELTDAGRSLVGGYSASLRKRLGLAIALLHEPRLLVLDEPFEGIDPTSDAVLRAVLRDFVGTVLLSSPTMAPVAGLCTRVVRIIGGRVETGGMAWSAS